MKKDKEKEEKNKKTEESQDDVQDTEEMDKERQKKEEAKRKLEEERERRLKEIEEKEICYDFACIGQKIPSFSAQAWTGSCFKEIYISDYIGKYVLLVFYSRNFTESVIDSINMINDLSATFKSLSKSF